MLRATALLLTLVTLAGCSVLSVDLTPRVKPLEEEVVEGHGEAKILLMDVSGFITDEAPSGGLGLGPPTVRVPMLVRVREELKKAAKDRHVRALVLRINTPGGTVTASDIIYREVTLFRQETKIPGLADGRIYTAPQALAKGLVDAIGYMPDALAAARSAIGVEDAKIIVYKRPREYQATYYAQTRTEARGLDATLERFATLAGAGPRFLYLWAP